MPSSFYTFYTSLLIEFQDDNRYSAGRGAHINLKRAERARVTVTKIPGIVFFRIRLFVWGCNSIRANKFSFQQLLTIWYTKLWPGKTRGRCYFFMMGWVTFATKVRGCVFGVVSAVLNFHNNICRHDWCQYWRITKWAGGKKKRIRKNLG